RYSPLRPLTTGDNTVSLTPAGRVMRRSTLCCTVSPGLPLRQRGGRRCDRWSGGSPGGLLLHRARGREALDRIHVGLLHLLEELASVGRERLDVPPLPLRVDGVEGGGRLARSRQPGDDHELVAGELEVDRLQIVLAGTADDDAIVGHGRSIILPRPGAVKPTPPPRDALSTGKARLTAR